MMNPKMVAQNRTARLVREARTPAYSTATPAAKPFDHLAVVEIDGGMGKYRVSMPESEVSAYLDRCWEDEGLSDLYHSTACKCGNPEFLL